MPSAAVTAVGLAMPSPWKARVTGTPAMPVEVPSSVTRPVRTPVAPLFGGRFWFAPGAVSSPPSEPAKKPMPRLAKTLQILFAYWPLKWAVSATRIAFRMSRNDGFDGDSSIARVTRLRATREPTLSRSDHSVWPQISPSPCTSGRPTTLP